VLVLDEPNAFLDQAGEAALIVAIGNARARGATVVVIAHRRGLIEVADRLLVLDAGRPKMIGPAKDVVARLSSPNAENAA
jgi:ATP-binding cassette subfamily C protein